MASSASYADCVSSLRTSLKFLESSVETLDEGVSDFPRLVNVLKSVRVRICLVLFSRWLPPADTGPPPGWVSLTTLPHVCAVAGRGFRLSPLSQTCFWPLALSAFYLAIFLLISSADNLKIALRACSSTKTSSGRSVAARRDWPLYCISSLSRRRADGAPRAPHRNAESPL